ncbi:HlyD family efflux transporter periplasmic adaptor subunit [Candidatus Dojkabacteria bacterium]|nr:HlyD family efflux transporter periplasmic adaptor subunit [Candidatus Dojkabacteria bacterium]
MKPKINQNNSKSSFWSRYSRLIILLITCSLLIASIYFTYIQNNTKVEKIPSTDIPIPVETIIIGEEDIYTKIIGTADNKNIVVIKSLTKGIVNKIKPDLGDSVKKDQELIELTETYTGNEIYDAKIEIAEKKVEQAKDYYNFLDKIEDEKTDREEEIQDNFEELQDLKEDKLESYNTQIETIENIITDIENILDSGSTNLDQKIDLTQELYDLKELRFEINLLEYETDRRYPGTEIADLENEINEKTIRNETDLAELDYELAKLYLDLLLIQADLRTLSSPINGTIEQILYPEGSAVQSGDELLIINGEQDTILLSHVSSQLAKNIDIKRDALIDIDGNTYEGDIEFVSKTPVKNSLYEIIIEPDKAIRDNLQIGASFSISLPIKTKIENIDMEIEDKIYIPIDSVYKTNQYSYVFVLEGDRAMIKAVQTGKITGGDQIEIVSGLEEGEILILTKKIVPNQKVIIQKVEEVKEEKDVEIQTVEPTESQGD